MRQLLSLRCRARHTTAPHVGMSARRVAHLLHLSLHVGTPGRATGTCRGQMQHSASDDVVALVGLRWWAKRSAFECNFMPRNT